MPHAQHDLRQHAARVVNLLAKEATASKAHLRDEPVLTSPYLASATYYIEKGRPAARLPDQGEAQAGGRVRATKRWRKGYGARCGQSLNLTRPYVIVTVPSGTRIQRELCSEPVC